jgi:hypothetical protein
MRLLCEACVLTLPTLNKCNACDDHQGASLTMSGDACALPVGDMKAEKYLRAPGPQ